jgi:tRNA dimethylallyltransferase
MKKFKKTLIILGPTASGKSHLAEKIADAFGGVILNADSMQIYKNFPILSAMPEISKKNKDRYELYGVLDILKGEQGSAAFWSEQAKIKIEAIQKNQKLPIIVGGTGFYIKALLEGLSPIPDIPLSLRSTLNESLKSPTDRLKLCEYLEKYDPQSAANISLTDTQRLTRALEVLIHTKKPLSFWQNMPKTSCIDGNFHIVTLLPEREKLYERINQRVKDMLKTGAIEEVETFLKKGGRNAKGIIGFEEICALLSGFASYEEVIETLQQRTRNYAKRQITWLRHQVDADFVIPALV